jgi:hypothetical protein
MKETEARIGRLEGDMARRPEENEKRWTEFARVQRTLKHLAAFNREQMKVWHVYAQDNYTAAKVWVEALFDPPLQGEISRMDMALTNEWARLKRRVWMLGGNMNNTAASHGRFKWILRTIDTLNTETTTVNETWVPMYWELHNNLEAYLKDALRNAFVTDEARVRYAVGQLSRYFAAGRQHQLERLLSWKDRTEANIAQIYRNMAKIERFQEAHDKQINVSIEKLPGWQKELADILHHDESGVEAFFAKELQALNASIDTMPQDIKAVLAQKQEAYEASMKVKVAAVQAMLEKLVASDENGLESLGDDKVRALNATIERQLADLDAYTHEQILLINASFFDKNRDVTATMAKVAFQRRRMVADLLSQVEEERMALTAVYNGSMDTEEAQRSAARRISGLLKTLAEAVADDTNATTEDASDETNELLANISETISGNSEREEADKKGMIAEYGSWVEDWAKNVLARINAVKAQIASSDAHVASETSSAKSKLESAAADLIDARDQISARVKSAQVADTDSRKEAEETLKKSSDDGQAHADNELAAAHARLTDFRDSELTKFIAGNLKSLREAVDTVLAQLKSASDTNAKDASEAEDKAAALLQSNSDDVANLATFYTSSDEQLLTDFSFLNADISAFNARLGRLRGFGPNATEAYNVSVQWAALEEQLIQDSKEFEGLVQGYKGPYVGLKQMVDGFEKLGNWSIETLRANWSSLLAWEDSKYFPREDARDAEEEALRQSLNDIDGLLDQYKAAIAAEKALWLNCSGLGGLPGEDASTDSVVQLCCPSACNKCGRPRAKPAYCVRNCPPKLIPSDGSEPVLGWAECMLANAEAQKNQGGGDVGKQWVEQNCCSGVGGKGTVDEPMVLIIKSFLFLFTLFFFI